MMGSENCRESDGHEFVEVDPTGRYGRYNEILGKGASKTVYRAFDEYEGIEVAWNQVKLYDFLQCSEDLERLYCEIHLLKTLRHKNIMKFFTSWVDTANRNINFVTEMFTSGTLRQYRQKHRRVNIRAVKHWCRQILSGLLYLHSHDPPIIHRDLKCDNIFINGNTGEVKIGDLGLAAILRKSHAVHCVGTPEFMAPEVYAEEYNELVDVYSFGMCVLEMVTFEYPYSECNHPAQIYKKVISGTKPEALYRVEDREVREFVEKCLATASMRLSARELLKDPFLQVDDHCLGWVEDDYSSMGLFFREPSHVSQCNGSLMTSGLSSNIYELEWENDWDCDFSHMEEHGMDLFSTHEDEHLPDVDITIKGRKKEDGSIFLRLRITDKDGHVRNIYFPFDLDADTALSVATEMVAELDITEYEVTRIAEMIDGEVSSLVPEWKVGPGIEETPVLSTTNLCKHCSSNVSSCGSLLEYLSLKNPSCADLQSLHCECAETHGRFEEVTYQVEGSECSVTEGAPMPSSQSVLDFGSQASRGIQSEDEEGYQMKEIVKEENSEPINSWSSNVKDHFFVTNDHERDVHQEQRLPTSKYQKQLQDYKNRRKEGSRRNSRISVDFSNNDLSVDNEFLTDVTNSKSSSKTPIHRMESFHLGTHNSFRIPDNDTNSASTNKIAPAPAEANMGYCWSSRPNAQPPRGRNCEASTVCGPELMTRANNLYTGSLLPGTFTGTKTLPVDAVDV